MKILLYVIIPIVVICITILLINKDKNLSSLTSEIDLLKGKIHFHIKKK